MGVVQERVQHAEEDDEAAKPKMNPAILGWRLRLAVLRVVEEAERELDQDKADDDEAEDLVVGAEAARLERVSNENSFSHAGNPPSGS